MKRLLIFLCALVMVSQMLAYSLLEREYGNSVGSIDARTAAMGGAGVSGGNRLFDYTLNPANLGLLPEGFGSQLAIGVMKNDDDRALPMYDFFDGYVDDATYVSNSNYFDEYSIGAYYKRNFTDYGISASISYLPYMNFDCYYEEEVRNDGSSDANTYPQIIAKNFIEGEGSINGLSFIAAFTYKDYFSAGVEVAQLKGENNLERRIIWSDYAMGQADGLQDDISETEREYEGLLFKFGILGDVNRRLSVGLSYVPRIEMDVEELVDSLKHNYIKREPARLRAGFSYRPRNIMRTYFNCDLVYVQWADVDEHYDNDINYYIGVEHQFRDMLPLRMGFRYETFYRLIDDSGIEYGDKITMPTFTVGTGFSFMNHFTVDVSAEYSNRKYEALDLFMDEFYDYDELWNYIKPQDRFWENPDQVAEKFIKLQTSISYGW